MQVSASHHAHQLGYDQHGDAVALVPGRGALQGSVHMYGDVQVLGKGLKGGEACGEDIDHDHIGPMVHCFFRPLQDSVRPSGDTYCIEGLLARLLLHPAQSGHDRLQPENKGAKALIGEGLVVLDQAHPGLDDGADEGLVVDAQNPSCILYPEPGTLMRPDYALRKDDILQAHLLEVSCHHREVLGDVSRLEEIIGKCDLDLTALNGYHPRGQRIVLAPHIGPVAGRLLGSNGLRRLLDGKVGFNMIFCSKFHYRSWHQS